MKRPRRVALAAIVVALALGALVPRLLSTEGAAGPPPASPPPRVETLTLAPRTLVERLATTGTVRANEEIEIVSEIAGKVAAVHFREGHVAAEGALLVKIDDTQLTAERDRAVHRATLAERSEARQKRLLDEGLVSQEEYDFALNELNVLRAELALAEARLLKTEIRAPFGGVIGLRDVSPGSYLTPQTRIATLQDVEPVKVDFSIPEKYVGQLAVGAQISFRTRGSEEAHVGTIRAIEPRVDLQTRSLIVRATSPNPDRQLVPGSFADVEVVVRRIEGAIAVPSRAVVPELGGKKVFVLEDGRAEARAVETGMRTGDEVEVVRGLDADEEVIVSGIEKLRPGLEVRRAEEGP